MNVKTVSLNFNLSPIFGNRIKGNINGLNFLKFICFGSILCYGLFHLIGRIKKSEKSQLLYTKALALLGFPKAQCENSAEAQLLLGNQYEEGKGVNKDPKEAARLYRLSAEQGNAKAQFLLANMLYLGTGIEKNWIEACRFYELSARQKNVDAEYFLGSIYEQSKDEFNAVKWYRRAAKRGHAEAQYKLASILQSSNNSSIQDWPEAARLYRLAGNQGILKAFAKLGLMYKARPKNVLLPDNADFYAEAIKVFQLGVNLGDSDCQFCLGAMYEQGHGVAQDKQKAIELYRLAAEQGNEDAKAALGTVKQ